MKYYVVNMGSWDDAYPLFVCPDLEVAETIANTLYGAGVLGWGGTLFAGKITARADDRKLFMFQLIHGVPRFGHPEDPSQVLRALETGEDCISEDGRFFCVWALDFKEARSLAKAYSEVK